MNDYAQPEQIIALGKQANDLMERHQVLPIPLNYELWYVHASQCNEALSKAIDKAVVEGKVRDLNYSRVLHSRFFGQESGDVFEEVGQQLNAELKKLLETIDSSSVDNAAFDKTLTHAGAELERGTPDVKSLVGRLRSATKAMQERNRNLEDKLQSSATEVAGLRNKVESIRKESLTDALTGLANRRNFDETMRKAVDVAVTENQPLSLIISDIDHFKKFNDTYGHPVGDQVLRLVAQCLKTNVKGKDLAARFGGEEFVVVLPNTSVENAAAVASDIRKTVEAKKIVKRSTGEDLGTITLSLGVAQYRPGEEIADLLNRADACLYAAKRGGRNRVLTEGEMAGGLTDGDAVKKDERSQDSKSFEFAFRAVCRAGNIPKRSEIDLRQFHRFARWMMVLEPTQDEQVLIRLAGSGFQELLGRDLTGMNYLTLVDPTSTGNALKNIVNLIQRPCGLWQRNPVAGIQVSKPLVIESTVFPMLNDKDLNKPQLLVFSAHDWSGGPLPAGAFVQTAVEQHWIDLGHGVPGAVKSAAA